MGEVGQEREDLIKTNFAAAKFVEKTTNFKPLSFNYEKKINS